jgi:hypothetical protein
MIHPNKRPGATLTEVLVAIFVMAIGLLALLTLFPIGALSMAQAIKDDRTAHAGKDGYANAIALNIQNDTYVQNNTPILLGPAQPGSSTTYFLNPYPTVPTVAGAWQAPDLKSPTLAGYDGPSYPIFVDPIGCRNFQSLGTAVGLAYPSLGSPPPPTAANPVGGPILRYSSIPRQPISSVPATATAMSPNAPVQSLLRWCTLMDDITFSAGKSPTELADAGTPALSTGAVQRENRYTWAWLLRRPNANDPSQVDINVVVYSGRSSTTLGETAYPGVFFGGYFDPTQTPPQVVPTKTFVDVPYLPGTRPNVRTGTWILDATMEYSTGAANAPDPHGYFYRVVGVTELGALPSPPYPAGSQGLRLEIQSTLKTRIPFIIPNGTFPDVTFTGTALAPQPYGVLVVMENVAEVF